MGASRESPPAAFKSRVEAQRLHGPWELGVAVRGLSSRGHVVPEAPLGLSRHDGSPSTVGEPTWGAASCRACQLPLRFRELERRPRTGGGTRWPQCEVALG